MSNADSGWLTADALEFAPDIVKTQEAPPIRYRRYVLYALLALFGSLLVWAIFGRLDIVAVAQGKLIPQTYLKVVQPADSGIVKEILVREGDVVKEGQVLMRMDTRLSDADRNTTHNEVALRRLQLRRIDAELSGSPMARVSGDPALFSQVEAQYRARRQAYQDALDAERAVIAKAQQDLRGSMETAAKLLQTSPIYREQEAAWQKLTDEGFAGRLYLLERQRQRIENQQDLRTQEYNVESLKATIAQSEKKVAQISSTYRQQLQNERVETAAQLHKLEQDSEKLAHHHGLLELKASSSGVVKDLATHTRGTVVQPGTVLLTIVPQDEPLLAEVWITNLDAGFIIPGQQVRVKLAAYPFQKYGMLDGVVRHVSADASNATEGSKPGDSAKSDPASGAGLNYLALVELSSTVLEAQGERLRLAPGMQVSAEILLGTRTVIEYLLSPIRKTVHEAARER